MRLYLIRHGRQCSRLCNVNVDLDEAGYRQAALLGERLANAQIDALYSSDLLRAVETARAANLYWNANHRICPELREISFGDMEGMTDNEIAVTYRDFIRDQNHMVSDLPYPGGECAGDVIKRALPLFQEIMNSEVHAAAIVTHGGVIRSMTAHYLGMDLAKWRMIGSSLENCSITEFTYHRTAKKLTVERLNDYAHLEPYPELLRKNWIHSESAQ